jgi:uncharacterized protein (TIGR02246 family)
MRLLLLAFANFIVTIIHGQTEQDKEQVKKVVLAFQDGFNEGSFRNAESYTTVDWEHINPFGGITKGRDSTLADVRRVHQTFLKGVTMKAESIDIRFPVSNVAIAVVVHQINNYTTPDGVQHTNEKHMKSYVIVKQKDKWLLTLDHNTIKIF